MPCASVHGMVQTFLVAAVTIGVAVLGDAGPPVRSGPVLVRKVVNGDTIDVQGIGRVHLLGIDAPFGTVARDRLASLVANRWVVLEHEVRGRETFTRRSAYVLIENGPCVNVLLVREGLARVSTRGALSRLDELKRAESEARTAGRGIWGGQLPRSSERYTLPRRKGVGKPRADKPKKSTKATF